MKKFTKHLAFCLAFFILPTLTIGQEVNTQGRDFWVSFLPNWPTTVPQLEILVSGQNPCTGIATNPLTGWKTTFTVTPGSVTSVVIPNSECLMEEANKIEHKAIHITTTDDVSLYASNYFDHSYDVANVLPTPILQSNYIALSYDVGALAKQSIQDEKSKMVIVGTEDNTAITIDPQGGLRGVFPPYSKKNITLNAGECYLCISARGDISGTSVNVKNGKKVAIFSGGDTQIPYDKCCYDAVFEQCTPTAYWGRHFVVTASAMRDKDMVRITSLAPRCRVSIDGKFRKSLGAKKSFDYKLDGTKKEAIYISASSPISVCVYLTSADWGGAMGDPSMVNINPIEQQMDKVTFATYNTAKSIYHFVNIVTQTDKVQAMTLDGSSIESEFQPVSSKPELSYARISVSHGAHTLESSNGGFVAHVYGLGPYESYAYSIGSSSKVLNQFDEDGNLILSNIPSEHDDADNTSNGTDLDDEAPITYSHTDTLSSVEFGRITLNALKNGEETRGVFKDNNGLILEDEIYDITTESEYDYLFEGIDANVVGDTIILSFRSRSECCDCFIPDHIRVDVIMTPLSDDEPNAGRIVIPISVPIEKGNSWFSRCYWVLSLITALLLFALYLLSLLRKKRFKKNAAITPTYYNYYGSLIDDQGPTYLRKERFVAWFARWFLPGDEQRTLHFDAPETDILFVAADSNEVVNLPKEGEVTNSGKIHINGYKPDQDTQPKEPIKLGSGDRITVYKSNGDIEGHLTFNSGEKSDGSGYRLLLGALLAMSVLCIITLLFLTIRGLM